MRWSSFRVRLTLWNVALMALVLGGFGVTLCYTVRARLAASVDHELAERAHDWANRWSRFAPPPLPPSRRPFPPLFGESPRPEPASPAASEAERRGFFRRPRILNAEGGPMIPFSGDEPWDPETFILSLAGREVYSTIRVDGEPVRVLSVPLWRGDEVEGVVQVAHPLSEPNRLYAGLVRTLLTLIPLALAVAFAGGLFLTDRALRPVRDITRAAAQIGAQDLSRRLPVTGHDELAQLAATFNGMIARLEKAFEQQRRFTADASHELRTPLTAIKANTSLALLGERSPEEYREALRAADHAADTMGRIVRDLLLLARSDAGQLHLDLRPVPLESLLEEAAASFAGPDAAPIRVEVAPPDLEVQGEPHHLMRLFRNLLENAVRHTPPDGSITVAARQEGGRVVVEVRDTGEGIPPEHLPHVCERFYRVDAARTRARAASDRPEAGGTGLGLSICQSIVQAHGGELEIASTPGVGTVVTVRLPHAGPGRPSIEPAEKAVAGSAAWRTLPPSPENKG